MDYVSARTYQLNRTAQSTQFHTSDGIVTSHLMFADDILIFYNGSRKSIKKVYETIKKFGNTTRINLNRKIPMYSLATKLPLPMWGGFNTIRCSRLKIFLPSTWATHSLLEEPRWHILKTQSLKLTTKFSLMKTIYYTLEEGLPWLRVLLTLSFFMFCNSLACLLAHTKRIEALFNMFIWRGNVKDNHWTSWRCVCKPKKNGGHGFKSL